MIEFHLFKQTVYENNPRVTKLLRDDQDQDIVIMLCKKCHTTLWNNCIIECVSCGNNTFRKSMCFIKKDMVLVYIVHLQIVNLMGKRCIFVKVVIEIFRRNLCVCHVGEKLQRKFVKFIKKMNMTSNNLLFCNVLVGAFLKLTVHIFVCHVTLHNN